MIELGAVLAGGFLGSAHCIGMCGGLSAALGVGTLKLRRLLVGQMIYSAGRICTYAFLGALAGASGAYLKHRTSSLIGVQQVFSGLAGVMMVWVGLSVLGWLPWRRQTAKNAGCMIAPLFRQFMTQEKLGGFFYAGLATGFLPCGLVYSFLALAVSSADVGYAMAMMACFGLGTVPAMVAVGCGTRFMSHAARAYSLQMAAGLVIIMGAASVYRAIPGPDGAACHTPAQAGTFEDSAACCPPVEQDN